MFANFDHLSDETDFQFPLPLSSATTTTSATTSATTTTTTAATSATTSATTTPAAPRLFPSMPKPSSHTFPSNIHPSPSNSTHASIVRQGSDSRSNNSTLSSIDNDNDNEHTNIKENSIMDQDQDQDHLCDNSDVVAGYGDGHNTMKPLAPPQLDTFTLFEDSMRLLVDIHGLRNLLVMDAASTADSLNTTLNQIRTSLLKTSGACSDHDVHNNT